jgi:hypothetical protein
MDEFFDFDIMGPEHDKAGKHDNTGKTAKVDKGKTVKTADSKGKKVKTGDSKGDLCGKGKTGDSTDKAAKVDNMKKVKTAGSKGKKVKAGIGKTPDSKGDLCGKGKTGDSTVKAGIGKTPDSKVDTGGIGKTPDSKDNGVKTGDSKGDKGGKGNIADSKGNKVKTGDSKGDTVKTGDSKGQKIKAGDSKDGNDKTKQKTFDTNVLGKGQWKNLPPASQLQGGLKLGVDCAGMLPEIIALDELKIPHTVVWATEQDAQKRRVIKHLHGDGFPVYMTVLEKNRAKAGNCDVLCGGFPCQPFSKVGLNQGCFDKRGTVVFEIIDYLQVCQPRLVVLENVVGLVNSHWADFKDLNEPTTGGVNVVGLNVS